MIEVIDILNLLGKELKDDTEQRSRLWEFIEKDKWTTQQIRAWMDECVAKSSGAHDPYNRVFQDLVVSVGKRLGFHIEYGRYAGRSSENNYDGVWKRENGDAIVLEVKTSTWPLASVNQLGDYVENLSRKEGTKNVFGLYVVGKGDVQPLMEQILGSKYKHTMRLIHYQDLMEIVALMEELEPVIGEKNAVEKVQELLLPIESVNIGNIIKLILEIATAKITPPTPEPPPETGQPWTKKELLAYLEDATAYQRLLLAALAQVDREPATSKTVTFLMEEIAKRRPLEGIVKKITTREIAGARGGLTMRRRALKKEDIIQSAWDEAERDYVYAIKSAYKEIVSDWVKKENLWVKDELG